MTAFKVHAEALERLARAHFQCSTYGEQSWEQLPDATRARWREIAAPLVDAIADLLMNGEAS